MTKSKKKKTRIIVITSVLIVVLWIFITLKLIFFKSDYRIDNIDYALSSVEINDDPYLYKTINEEIRRKNIFVVSRNLDKTIKNIQKDFPFVKDISVDYKWPKTALVKITFE